MRVKFFLFLWWCDQMETFSTLLALCAWINGWVNNHRAGDLKCHRAHYDVIVMKSMKSDPIVTLRPAPHILSARVSIVSSNVTYCSGSLEPESSCHDRDWIMELPMEADILTFTGILTPEDASVASCFPFDITISLSWFPPLSIPLLHSAIP